MTVHGEFSGAEAAFVRRRLRHLAQPRIRHIHPGEVVPRRAGSPIRSRDSGRWRHGPRRPSSARPQRCGDRARQLPNRLPARPGETHCDGPMNATGSPSAKTSEAPARAGLVLAALIIVAAVANLNLSVANVALPDIGKHFDSSQTTLDLIAVGYSLGLACSVLWLGALGDRYGRKLMLLLGTILAIPMSLLAAYAPTDIVLFAARLGGGIAAGMAYPTTLALITALWAGAGRTKAIAMWSAIGGAIASLGPLCSGFLLQHYYWGS